MCSELRGVLVLVILMQAGCASYSIADLDQLPAERLPVGSSFFLNQDINIGSGILGIGIPSIPIQNGRVTKRFAIQQFEPYCEFILNSSAKGDTLVTVDNFVVESVSLNRNFMRRDQRPVLVAAGPGLLLADSESGSPGFNMTVIDYTLSTEFQGSGYVMRCRSVSDPSSGRLFTVATLRETLGALFSVQVLVQSLDGQ